MEIAFKFSFLLIGFEVLFPESPSHRNTENSGDPHHMMSQEHSVPCCSNFVRGLPLSYFNLIMEETKYSLLH